MLTHLLLARCAMRQGEWNAANRRRRRRAGLRARFVGLKGERIVLTALTATLLVMLGAHHAVAALF